MKRPTTQPCTRTYARIIAHCTIRTSTAVGDQMRVLAGKTGDITAVPTETMRAKFSQPKQQEAAVYLMALALYIKQKFSRGGYIEQA